MPPPEAKTLLYLPYLAHEATKTHDLEVVARMVLVLQRSLARDWRELIQSSKHCKIRLKSIFWYFFRYVFSDEKLKYIFTFLLSFKTVGQG